MRASILVLIFVTLVLGPAALGAPKESSKGKGQESIQAPIPKSTQDSLLKTAPKARKGSKKNKKKITSPDAMRSNEKASNPDEKSGGVPKAGPMVQRPPRANSSLPAVPGDALLESLPFDVRLVEMARTGRTVSITGRADRAVSAAECCDIELRQGGAAEGGRVLWRGRAQVIRIGSGHGFIATATYTVPPGLEETLTAKLVVEDRIAANNVFEKKLGSTTVGGFVGLAGDARDDITNIRIATRGRDWAVLLVDYRIQNETGERRRLKAIVENLRATCVDGVGQNVTTLHRDLIPGESQRGTPPNPMLYTCTGSEDGVGRIRVDLTGDGRILASRSLSWRVDAVDGSIDHRAARTRERQDEASGSSFGSVDLAVDLEVTYDSAGPSGALATVTNHSSTPLFTGGIIEVLTGRTGALIRQHHFRTPQLAEGDTHDARANLRDMANWGTVGGAAEAGSVRVRIDPDGDHHERSESNNSESIDTQNGGRFYRPSAR
ncbi:MAG: hypothetical protein GY937_04665 [bacterium]|nr:hypothetical protein [bacterium]